MKILRTLVLGGLVLALVTAARAQASVLEQVPSDALVVIKVNNLERTSGRMGRFARDLGLAQMAPQFANPLQAFQEQMDIEQGLRREGDMAIAILHPQAVGEDAGEPTVLVLVPISDYDAFLRNFDEVDRDGDITEVTVGEDEEPAFVTRRGEYAAMSPLRAVLEHEAEGVTTRGLTEQQMQEKDIVAYVNFPAIRPYARQGLQDGRRQFMQQMERAQQMRGQPQQQAQFQPLAEKMFEHGFNLIERVINETEAATYGVNFAEAGINGTLLADFQEDSDLARTFGQLRTSGDSLLQGLPQGRYLLYGGSIHDPERATRLIDSLTQPFMQDLRELGDTGRPIMQYIESIKAFIGAHHFQAFGMIAPTGAIGQESLVQGINVYEGNAEAMRDAMRRMFETQHEMMRIFDPQQAQATTTVTANARTIDGVTLDRFQTRFDLDPQTPEQAQAAQMLALMYGPEGINGYIGVVGENRLIAVTGGPEALLERTIASAREQQDPLAQRVQAVAGQLPEQRAMVVYIPLDVTISTALTYARNFGFAIPVQIPPDLPPIGVTAGSQDNAFRMDSHVPTQLVQSLVAAGLQVYMQMMQGAFGPGPGGL